MPKFPFNVSVHMAPQRHSDSTELLWGAIT